MPASLRPHLCLALAALLTAALPAPASETPRSLNERRLEVIKGTAEGRKLLDLGSTRKPEPAQAAASAGAGAGAGAGVGAGATAAPAEPRSALFSKLPPPSGRPLNAARRHEGAGLGVPVPTAAAASQPR
jgi:hypothetical protein